MPSRRHLSTALILASLAAGCSHQPDLATFTINAAPGQFHAFDTKLEIKPDATDISRARVEFLKLQPSTKWAPVIAICVLGMDAQSAKVCLHLAAHADGQVYIHRAERVAGQQKFTDQQVGGPFLPTEPFVVRAESSSSRIRFSVNGEPVFESSKVAEPTQFEFSCSSAVCSFDLLPEDSSRP